MQYEKKQLTYENIDSRVNLIPLKNTFNDILFLFKNGLSKNMNLYTNIIGNIILFMPLPFFLISFLNIHKKIYILLCGALISIWVEAMQYVFILGVTDIDDILLNVLGTWLGIILLNQLNKNRMRLSTAKYLKDTSK